MKKSLLNTAITMAMTTALLSGAVLNTQAYAGEPGLSATDSLDNTNNKDTSHEDYMLPGIGVGAATGAVVAGPVGLIFGGIIGAFVGSNQEVKPVLKEDLEIQETSSLQAADKKVKSLSYATQNESIENLSESELAQRVNSKHIQVAQLGSIKSVVDDSIGSQMDELVNILTTDLSLDIYFRSGSTDIESFYPARLAAIADLMHNMDKHSKDKLELHLDGYTDRRGNKTQNVALANERIEKVREQLINAGVDKNRIINNAFGEIKMVSSAGDLDAYTFDRKVVIRFERTQQNSAQPMAAVTDMETKQSIVYINGEQVTQIVADAATRF